MKMIIRKKMSENQKLESKHGNILKLHRPEVVNAKVYKIKSPFVKFKIYVTLSYVMEAGKND